MSKYHTTLLDLCTAYLALLFHSKKKEDLKKCIDAFKIAEKMAIFYKIDHSLQYFKLIANYIKLLLLRKGDKEDMFKYL
jgi:hypothetical protein